MDVAQWCYQWIDGWDWKSLGGVRYGAPYCANHQASQGVFYFLLPSGDTRPIDKRCYIHRRWFLFTDCDIQLWIASSLWILKICIRIILSNWGCYAIKLSHSMPFGQIYDMLSLPSNDMLLLLSFQNDLREKAQGFWAAKTKILLATNYMHFNRIESIWALVA